MKAICATLAKLATAFLVTYFFAAYVLKILKPVSFTILR